MENVLKSALDFSNYNQTLNVQRKILREKLDARLTYGHAGGIFKINASLISFVQMLIDRGRSENIPIVDENGNPVLDGYGSSYYNLERKTKFGRWKQIDWSWDKPYLIENAERRFKRQKATEFILIDETQKEFTLKDGKVLIAA